ncbi:hypothetical protein ASE86_07795 [Sphingomonas sp. Leaf33]|uniref:DUF2497 domain-containing protein n=1 Tax=Sphingomonas sp. Leaf33 TaxID=1736215 RepID=UPI0006FC754D|nr:DUF2497 domain-containing protein [Sphingomonas sp. Leaf33]KQN26055.1 hypothetical protein ASE86_07795 [Sphingomonas sp. Leaf33]
MGDVSSEPTMEEILSSIKRVIEESETPAGNSRGRRVVPRPIVAQDDMIDDGDGDEVLELSERAPFPAAEPPLRRDTIRPMRPPPAVDPASIHGDPAPARPDALASPDTVEASRSPLEALSRLIVKPDVAGADTLEGLVREMLRPMLRDWLDSNLPSIVETMVAKEIARISGRGL